MAKHRTHSIEFKRQVAQEYLAGETLHGLAKRHDLSRNLIRIWVRSTRPAPWTTHGRRRSLQEYEAGSPPSSAWSASKLSSWSF